MCDHSKKHYDIINIVKVAIVSKCKLCVCMDWLIKIIIFCYVVAFHLIPMGKKTTFGVNTIEIDGERDRERETGTEREKGERERDRERERNRDRERDRERDRDRDRDKDRDWQGPRQTERERQTETDREWEGRTWEGTFLGGSMRIVGSHSPGGRTVTWSRNSSIPERRSVRSLAL